MKRFAKYFTVIFYNKRQRVMRIDGYMSYWPITKRTAGKIAAKNKIKEWTSFDAIQTS